MEASKHTPGPWVGRINKPGIIYEGGDSPATVGSRDGRHLATIQAQGSETLPNLHLMKAAPDLLEVADAVLEWARAPGEHGGNPYCKEFVRLAEKAKAKVEGGTPC